MSVRRVSASLIAVVFAFGLTALLGGAAQAAPAPNCANPAGKYPPGQNKVAMDQSTYKPGETAHFTTDDCVFDAHEHGKGTVASTPQQVGTYTADANGAMAGSFTVPSNLKPGTHTFTLTGDTSGVSVSAQFTVTSAKASGLPFTGSNSTIPLAVTGIAVIAIGSGLLVAARRRMNSVTVA